MLLADLLPLESLYVCRRSQNRTIIEPFKTAGPLYKKTEIEAGLDDVPPPSAMILRGDLDG